MGAAVREPEPAGASTHSSNFFLGNDPAAWRVGVGNFEEVVYHDLYPGVDLAFRVGPAGAKSEWRIASAMGLEAIRLGLSGTEGLSRNPSGELVIVTPAGEIREGVPVSYIESGEAVDCRYVLRGPAEYGFECAGWDGRTPLVIDPLIYSSFLGGSSSSDRCYAIATDSSGAAYLTGVSDGTTGFPATPGAYSTSMTGGGDAIVVKLNASGSSPVFSTYFGGGSGEAGNGIAVDAAGNVFITGPTTSSDMPTTAGAPSRNSFGGIQDAFVAKFNATGGGLVYSTYLGSNGNFDSAQAIAVDGNGNAFVAGGADGTTFPTTVGAFRTSKTGGTFDAFVAKLNANGSSLLYATYLGGNGDDYAATIAVDSSGNAFVGGYTWSADYPVTSGAFITSNSASFVTGFVTKLNAAGTGLLYSTYLGGSGQSNEVYALTADASGNATAVGYTYSTSFPVTAGAYATNNSGGGDAFVAQINASGNGLNFATLLGGTDQEIARGVALDSEGNTYVVGITLSSNFPATSNAFDGTSNGGYEAFVAKFNANLSTLSYATYLGGSGEDRATAVALGPNSTALVGGYTASSDFPTTPGAFNRTFSGNGMDFFIAEFGPPSAPLNLTGSPGNQTSALAWSAPANDGGASFTDYRLYRGTSANNTSLVANITGAVRNFTDLNLTNGLTYFYEVSAVNAFGEGTRSLLVNATPFTNATQPLSLAVVGGLRSISIAWSAPAFNGGRPVTNYTLYRSVPAGPKSLVANLSNVTSVLDSGLANGTTYCYEVRAVNLAGEGPASAEACATTFDFPDAPQSLTALEGNGTVSLSWAPPLSDGGTPVLGYVLYRGNASGAIAFYRNVSGVLNFTDSSLSNGLAYFYAVSALNLVGEGPLSFEVTATPKTLTDAPTLLPPVEGYRRVALSWAPPGSNGGAAVLEYTLYRGTSPGNETPVAGGLVGLAYLDTNVTNGQVYFYRVSATNIVGAGPLSNRVSATPGSTPSQPLNASATPGNGSVTLAWYSPSDNGGFSVTNYTIYRRTTATNLTAFVTVGAVLQFNDQGLARGEAYFYAITATNARGEGLPSLEFSASAQFPPGAPTSLSITGGPRSADLSWTPPTDTGGVTILAYNVYRGSLPNALALYSTVSTSTSFLDAGLLPGQPYFYQVGAVNLYGEGPRSSTVNVTVHEPPAILRDPPRTLLPGVNETFALEGSDPEGRTPLTFEMVSAAPWIQVSRSGLLSFAPPLGEHGPTIYAVAVRTPDGRTAQRSFAVSVGNRRPIMEPGILPADATPRVPYSATFNISDPDADPVSVLAEWNDSTQAPLLTHVGGATWRIDWTPTYSYSRAQPFLIWLNGTILVNDSFDPAAYNVSIRVMDPPDHPPAILPAIPDQRGYVADRLWVNLSQFATDEDAVDTPEFLNWTIEGDISPVGSMTFHASNRTLEILISREGSASLVFRLGDPSNLSDSQTVLVQGLSPPLPPLPPLWWLLLLLAGAGAGAAVVVWRRRQGRALAETLGADATEPIAPPAARPAEAQVLAPVKPPGEKTYLVEDVFLLYRDGRPMFTRGGLGADAVEDPELLGSMLVAVQDFVKDAFKKRSDVERMMYGENSILLERGKHVILALTVFGAPDKELKDQMVDAVANIEGHFAGLIESWDGNRSAIRDAERILAPLWLATADLTRGDVLLATTAREVQMISGVEFFQGYVRLKVAVVNNTTSLIAGVTVDVDSNADVLRLHKIEPATYKTSGSKVQLGVLHTGEKATLAYYFDPQICTVSQVDGTCRYKDHEGRPHVVQMKTRTAEVVCPLFFTKEQANTAMLKRLIETELKQYDVRGYAFKPQATDEDLHDLFEALKSAVLAHDVQMVRAHEKHNPYLAEAWFYGKTQAKGYQMVIRAVVDEEKGKAEFYVSSTVMRSITGLLAELYHTLQQEAEGRLADLGLTPLFDESLKRSYANPAAVSKMVEGEAEAGETDV